MKYCINFLCSNGEIFINLTPRHFYHQPAEFLKWNNPPAIFGTFHYNFKGFQDNTDGQELSILAGQGLTNIFYILHSQAFKRKIIISPFVLKQRDLLEKKVSQECEATRLVL